MGQMASAATEGLLSTVANWVKKQLLVCNHPNHPLNMPLWIPETWVAN